MPKSSFSGHPSIGLKSLGGSDVGLPNSADASRSDSSDQVGFDRSGSSRFEAFGDFGGSDHRFVAKVAI